MPVRWGIAEEAGLDPTEGGAKVTTLHPGATFPRAQPFFTHAGRKVGGLWS